MSSAEDPRRRARACYGTLQTWHSISRARDRGADRVAQAPLVRRLG